MGLYHYTGGQVKQIPVGAAAGASLLRYIGGQVVRPGLYRYIGGQVLNLGTDPATQTPGAFAVLPSSGLAPLSVKFLPGMSATTYVWNFGDGSTSTQFSPTHVYQTAGTYTASLTVTSASGSGTQTRTIVVTSVKPPPLATSTTRTTSTTLLTQG